MAAPCLVLFAAFSMSSHDRFCSDQKGKHLSGHPLQLGHKSTAIFFYLIQKREKVEENLNSQ